VRRQLYPRERGLKWNGVLMWRGATLAKGFLDGRTMIVGGGFNNKLVLYPIAPGKARQAADQLGGDLSHGRRLQPAAAPEDWNQAGQARGFAAARCPFSHAARGIDQAREGRAAFYEYPMADRDPLPRWTHGRVTLLGDACPSHVSGRLEWRQPGDLDARLPGRCAGGGEHRRAALIAYEADALPKTAEIVRNNRRGGPEGVIDEVERRAPDGFRDI
jgi:hypothetical protein